MVSSCASEGFHGFYSPRFHSAQVPRAQLCAVWSSTGRRGAAHWPCHPSPLLCTGAESPALCSVVVNRQAGRGALAMLHGIAASIGSVTSGAVGLARAAGNRVLNTPVNITLGEWRGTFMRATALALKRPHTSPETAV